MKIRLLALILLVLVTPALAQDRNTVAFNAISFEFDSTVAQGVLAERAAGDPINAEMPGGPTPPHIAFTFAKYAPFPDEEITSFSPAIIRVFRMSDMEGYPLFQQQSATLRGLLDTRPDLAPYTQPDTTGALQLPYLPGVGASQIIRAKAEYVETDVMRGIRYLMAYAQDVSPLANWQVSYTFQGITNDGVQYVSATFRLLSGVLPAEIAADFDYDAFSANYEQYLSETSVLLNEAAVETFQPSPLALDALVASISIPVAAVDPVGPSSLAGLEGTWKLASYGPADAPLPVLETAPITLIFAPDGINGNAGCNGYFGQFTFDQGVIGFSGVGSTMMACDQPVLDQETSYLQALGSATGYQIDGDTLRITYPEGVLVFTR